MTTSRMRRVRPVSKSIGMLGSAYDMSAAVAVAEYEAVTEAAGIGEQEPVQLEKYPLAWNCTKYIAYGGHCTRRSNRLKTRPIYRTSICLEF
jgi:hypothetical protein